MIRNIYCDGGCGSKQGHVDVPPGAKDAYVKHLTSGYLCERCARKVEIGGLLKNSASPAAEQMKAFSEKWDGKMLTKEAYAELFAIVNLK